MAKAISNIGKKRGRGRPRVGATPVLVALPPDQLAALDGWIKRRKVEVTRPEAIRQLISQALQLAETQGTAATSVPSRRMQTGKPRMAAKPVAKAAVTAKAAASKRPARRTR
jgi:hypothetical protein